jgi:hypothetical protein
MNPSAVVTSTGKTEIKMSKEQATALAATASAKKALANAIARTIDLPASIITITGIYIDGVKVGSRRLTSITTDSTVRVDWMVKAEEVVKAPAMDANALKANIEAEVKTVTGITIVITETPSVVVDDPNHSTASSASSVCLGSFLLAWIVLVSLA